MQALVNARGTPIGLGPALGRGGEGSVFELRADSNVVAKVYHRPPTGEKQRKILAMAEAQDEALTAVAAWPIEPLFQNRNKLIGFTMRRIEGYEEAHNLYSPKSRRTSFSTATWPFLVHAAKNIAKAFAVVHERGHVIGDVNHGNVLVSPKAMAALIDCDSFQVRRNGHTFLCEVGVSTYTPPELQGKSFAGIERTANHDNFGLAVLIFHLLFMGRHPFAGRYAGPEEITIEKAIERCLFAYGSEAPRRKMNRPPHTLALACVTERVAQQFENAFSVSSISQSLRPRAIAWVTALEAMSSELCKCTKNPSHDYLKRLATCPWCEIERHTSAILFGFAASVGMPYVGQFDIQLVWNQITSVIPPSPLPNPPGRSIASSQAARPPLFSKVRLGFIIRRVLGWSVMALGGVSWMAAGGPGFLAMLFLAWIGYLIATADPGGLRTKAKARLQAAKTRVKSLEAEWRGEADNQRFERKFAELVVLKKSYEDLPAERTRRMRQLEADKRKDQLDKFLDAHYIAHAKIPGIGSGRTSMLESYGIETALDVTYSAVDAVPGFGRSTALKLVVWRQKIERKFTFNPGIPVDSGKVRALEQELIQRQSDAERKLREGPAELVAARNQITVIRLKLTEAFRRSYEELLQAEAEI